MKRLLGAVFIAGTTILGSGLPAQAGGATDAALALGAFAVFNQFVRGETVFHNFFQPAAPVIVQQPVVVQQPVFVAAPPPVVVRPTRRVVATPVLVVPRPPVVYVAPPAPVVYYAPPAIGHARAPAYYAPKRVRPAHHGKIGPHRGKHD